ncbi:DUF2490 domain-containing protein [Methylocystis sp. L43]|uniref:DUF2490 domain-containing protein n=1 Tax=unclassified Methylocystis TaxID=2625913 RepID=UPI0032B150C3
MSAATIHRTRRLAACGGSLLGIFATAGPAAAVDEDFRIWENVTTIAKLGSIDPSLEKWRLWLESQGRFRNDGATADQALGRAGVGYALSDKVSLWLGYAHIATFPQDAKTQHENRIWQQVLLTDKATFGDMTSRTRLEQRFIQNVNPVEWRLRQFVRFSHPLWENAPLSLVLWDEVFVRLNSTTPSTRFGFDQNRGFAGLGYSFSEKARVEVGYMNQLIQSRVVSRREQKFDHRINHILSVSMFLNL